MPERLELDLKAVSSFVRPGEPVAVDTTARYLYGAIGSNLNVTGEFKVEAADDIALPALKGYQVGLTDETFEAVTGDIEADAVTDAQGKARVVVALQETKAIRPLQVGVTLHVAEPGGRAVTRSVTVPIVPAGSLIGVKPLQDSDKLTDGGKAEFDVVLVNPEGKRIARPGVKWVLNKVDRRYQWFYKEGRWNYEALKTTRAVANGVIDLNEAADARISSVVKLGSYRLDVTADGLTGAETSVSFSVGWDGERTASAPDVLDMTLDKKAYAAGDTIQVKARSTLWREGHAGDCLGSSARSPNGRHTRKRRDGYAQSQAGMGSGGVCRGAGAPAARCERAARTRTIDRRGLVRHRALCPRSQGWHRYAEDDVAAIEGIRAGNAGRLESR